MRARARIMAKLDETLRVEDSPEYVLGRLAGLREAAEVAQNAARVCQRTAADWEDVDQPHTAEEAWEYAADEALEIATAILALAGLADANPKESPA